MLKDYISQAKWKTYGKEKMSAHGNFDRHTRSGNYRFHAVLKICIVLIHAAVIMLYRGDKHISLRYA